MYNNIILQLINDEKFVSKINEVSNSIYNYYKAIKGNYSIIDNNYKLLINKYNNINEVKNIMKIYFANKENLDYFISDQKILFQDLRELRQEQKNKICNFFTNIKNNTYNIELDNKIVIEKNRYFKIMNLLISLNKFKENIELNNSEEESQEFTNILIEIINQLKKTEKNNYIINKNNNKNMNTNKSPQINISKNSKNKFKEFQRKKELELKNDEILQNNKIKQELIEKNEQLNTLKEKLKSIDIKYNDIVEENNKNKSIIV